MIGQSLAHYKITDKIGEGGMGVVFRARDSKLDRDVAIKVLPQEMSADAERAARFAREARTLASLQHANIASIYGYEETDGVQFLVMELVEGEDLGDRLLRGAVPLDEALDIAEQIAAGLEAAHDQNIIHRDLKPANVKVTPSGEVKILDFGLARAYLAVDEASSPVLSHSPTITENMTRAGVILGTAAYMSPEQAKGKPVDRRTDLWAYGVILFEMLTGTRLFEGETVSDTLAAVLREDIDFEKLPGSTPSSVRRLLRRCLERDPRVRLRSAGDAALELREPEEAPAGPDAPGKPKVPVWAWGVMGFLAFALVLSFVLGTPGGRDLDSGPSFHLEISLPEGFRTGDIPPAISPDGKWVAYGAIDSLDNNLVFLRPLNRFESHEVSEIITSRDIDVGFLFWSPDSEHLGIMSGTSMFSLDVATRSLRQMTGEMAFARGASWGSSGEIIFAPTANSGIFVIDESGGERREVTAIDSTRADASHRWPAFLPDGNRFLFTQWSNSAEEQDEIGGIFLASLDGMEPVRILKDISQALVDPTGYILFHRQGKLQQVAFDFDAGSVTGSPGVVAENVEWSANNGSIVASVSQTGDIALGPPAKIGGRSIELGWLDFEGNFDSVMRIDGDVFSMFLDASGRYAALDRISVGSSLEIWIADLERATISLLSRFGSDCWGGAFSPDGKRYVYTGQDPGFERLYVHSIDGATDPVRLLDLQSVGTNVYHWSEGGELFFSHRDRTSMTYELWAYDFESAEARALLSGDTSQDEPILSPDGRWLAYTSQESGRLEVYIRSYPALDRKWQVSTNGGFSPHWREDGQQLIYASSAGVTGVTVASDGDNLNVSTPFTLMSPDPEYDNFIPNAQHTRLLCSKREDSIDARPFRFISNWHHQLPE